ncbi:non-ribosomal peptide synthetase [Pseudomonas trivialis]|uniref:non-ribosomal peptide synthetase n=3 Tax=Pseudomonas TaxID=286 RepID=UPI000CFB3B77|nr:non-ribosomal peptide synthetase [Pseudomonas trivialis]PQZ88949.1 non-ribosomal peptide synthetase [Pseudomonas trivialis]
MLSNPNIDLVSRFLRLPLEQREQFYQRLQSRGMSFAQLPIVSVREEGQALPLSYAQERQWFLWQLDPDSAAYHIPGVLRLTGNLDKDALQRSFDSLLARHESLRTRLNLEGEQRSQVVLEQARIELLETAVDEARLQDRVQAEIARPFDLQHGPLLRLSLFKLSEQEHVLVLVQHHIVSDGWSMGVMVQELLQFYAAYSQGFDCPLPPLPIQYADYALWQRRWMEAGEKARQLGYWCEQLGGTQPVLELPLDHPRPARQSYRGARHDVALEPALVATLKALAKREGVTLFMLLLASFQTLLYRYSGQSDIRVGVPNANRNRGETEGLIGFFVNTQVLKADLDGQMTFSQVLAHVKQRALEAQSHQDLPFEQLVEALQPERSLSHNPLFQVMFNHQTQSRASAGAHQLPGLVVQTLESEEHSTQFDLSLDTEETEQGLWASWTYATDLFEARTVARMARHWQRLLHILVTGDVQVRIEHMAMLAADEQQQMVHTWNHSAAAFESAVGVHGLFEAQARQRPHAVALCLDEQSLSYDALNRRANQLAHYLIDQGVGPEVMVGVAVERSFDMVVSLLAILKAGGAYVPLDPHYPRERLLHMVQDSGVRLVLCHCAQTLALAPDVQRLDIDHADAALQACAQDNPQVALDPHNLAYVIYTSGSTGKPKGVAIHHRALTEFSSIAAGYSQLTADDRVLQFATLNFDGFVEQLYPALTHGATVVLRGAELWDSGRLYAEIIRQGITLADLPTAYWNLFLLDCLAAGPRSYGALRQVHIGGEAMPLEGPAQWVKAGLGHVRLLNTYGPTEATVVSSVLDCTTADEVIGATASPIGRALPGRALYVLDRDLNLTPLGAVGELYIGSPCGLARAYLNRPLLSAERFVPDPFGASGERLYRSGDLARYRADGVIEYVGRVDHQVKIRGFRIELGEIEALLLAQPGVREAVVVAADNQLIAYLVADPQDADTLKRQMREQLPDYMVPAHLLFLERMPLNPNGKLDRQALPQPDASQSRQAWVAPVTELEQHIAAVWAEILGAERVGLNDHFFEMGGHSLLAMRVVSQLRQLLGRDVPLRCLFEQPRLDAFVASVLAQAPGAAPLAPPLTAVGREHPLRLSYAQERQWFLWQLDPDSAAYHIPSALRLRGQLDIAALQRSFDTLVARHESLRTQVQQAEEGAVQVILAPAPLPITFADVDEAGVQARVETEIARLFNLQQGPLLRVSLLRLAADEHVLVLVQHHIVSDGWSMQVMVDELVQLYAAYSQGQDLQLPGLPIQYADYALWQRDWMEAGEKTRQLDYWREQLGGEQPVLELPFDHQRPAQQSHRGARLEVLLPDALTAGLKALAQAEGVTMFMLLLASFQALLHRYSGQQDVRVGVPIANRNRVETERLIGFFVNTQVLKADIDGHTTFSQLLAQVKQRALEAQAHQDLPFEQLVEALQPERSLSLNPLFQVMFNFQTDGPAAEAPSLAQLAFENLSWETRTAHFDLDLDAHDSREGLWASLGYSTDLFERSTIERMARHWQNLLQAMVTDRQQNIGQSNLLDADEQQHILHLWNQADAGFPNQRLVHELFADRAAQNPHAVAVKFDAQTLTYGELDRQANRLAHALIARGVGPEVRVAIAMPRSAQSLVAFLGVLKSGGVYVPLDIEYPRDRLLYMMQDSRAQLLLTHTSALPQLPMPDGLQTLAIDRSEEWSDGSDTEPHVALDGDNLAYVIYTSGSTGMPKGVAVSHGPLVAHIIATGERYETSPSDCELHFMSFAFDGSHEGWMHPLINGASVLIRDDSLWLPEYTYAQMHRHNVTMAVFPPVYLQQLAEHAERDGNPPAVRVYCFGGDAVAQASYDLAWRALKPTYLFNGYGPTETVVTPLLWKARKGDPCGAVYAPIGTLLGNRSGYVLDAQLNLQPIGVAGELYLGGEGVARGYLERPALTAERFVPDPFGQPGSRVYRSGDLTRGRPDGVVDYLGRVDHQVKIRGFRIELGEIEARLREQDNVGETVVVAQEGPSGKQLVAYVVPAAAQVNEAGLRDALRIALKARLPDYMVPAHFMFLAQMPLTPNGKLDRRNLPQPDISQLQQAYVAPQNALEQQIAAIWADVLRLPRVGLNDNFFELGGDSIISIQVVSRARQAGVRFTPKDLFQHQTVQSLAAVATLGGQGLVIDQGLVSGEALLLPIHQYFFQEDIAERHHWNQSVVLRPGVRLDGPLLNTALLALIEHHDALRLRFSQASGNWQARYHGVEAIDSLLWQANVDSVDALEPLGQQAQRSLDLGAGPLLRAVLVALPDGTQRLLLVIHHLVVDGVSWRILLEDLQTAYTQLQNGQAIKLPAKTSSTHAWAKRLQAHAQSPALQEELRFWQAQLHGADADLPCDNPHGALHNALAISVNTHLDPSFTRRLLQEAPAAYRTQVNDLLLTALSRVITRWTGGDSLLVKLEGHGREDLFDDMDLTRTVGWFTSMYPLALRPAASLADSIKGIKEQLRAVPDKGIGFGALRYLGDEQAQRVLSGLAQPRITFNYLGQFDGTFADDAEQAFFTPTGEEAGAEQSEHALLGNWLEINGQVFGGELTLSWSFSREMFSEATVQRLADAYALELEQLIEHCCRSAHQGVTPSDFPLAALTQAQLDQFALAAVDDVYPLVPLQQGMLFHALYEPQAGDYVNQMRVDVEGLDVPRFRDAWQAALDNHDILRTGFILHGSLEHPLQVVHRHAQFPFIEVECTETDGQPQRLDRLAETQRLQGFDLERPPLIRIALAHTGPQRCHLIYTSHHILMDGWSSSQLLGEVLERYAGHAPQPQVSRYRDFIAWLQGQDKTLREAFWKPQLALLDEPTRLFQALPRNPDRTASGLGEYALDLDAAHMARLKAFAQGQKITLNTLVQSAWLLLLQRYTGQTTVAFGATVSGRPADLRGVEQQVGLFINTLPVVATPRPEMLAAQWLQQIQQQNVALREHEHTPLFELQRWAGLGGEALFDSILVFENYPVSEVLEQGAPLGVRFGNVNSREQTHYPLSIAVGVGETLSLHYTYDLAEVDAPTIVRLNQHLLHLLLALVAKPQAPLAQLTLLSEPEHQALLAQGNGVVNSFPFSPVQQQFEQQVRRTPQATAVVFGDQRLSFDALNRRANRLAHGLIAQGVGPDALVAIAMERSFDMLAGLLAILKAGGAYVPLDADYPQERLAYMLKDNGVKWLLTQSPQQLPLPDGVQCLSLQGDPAWLAAGDDSDPQVAVDGENLMYVIYTSGTTGNPKGVGVTHAALVQRLAWMQDTYRLQADDVLLQKAPVSFDVSVWECFWPLISGSQLVIAAPGEHRDPMRLLELIQAHRVTTLHFIPSLLQLFMDTPGVAQCTAVRRLFSGGEALSAELRDQILRTLPGVVLHNRYGPTETTINATWWPCSLEDGARSPIGQPLDNGVCRVLDAALNPVPAGVAGELYVGGEGLARGYLGRPGLSAERFVADPLGAAGARLYRTGDRVRWSADGALEYLGRLDQQIKIRGFRVELEEIGALLLQHADVAQAEVILRAGSGGGQLIGYYVAHPTAPEPAEHGQALRDALHAQLPDYMVPKHFVRLVRMPLSPSGKLDRKALPEPEQQVAQGEYLAPQSALEQQLAAIWQDVLEVGQVGLNDNFFERGGHSLLVINVMSRIQLELGVKISVHELFQHAQLKQLADHLHAQGSGVSTEKLSFLDSLLDEMEEV